MVTGKRRRLERKERICRQCGTGTEDEIHVLLYCPLYVPIRRELIHDLKKDSPAEDIGLEMFLTGLCHAANVQWDRMEAEKTLILMMGKKRILQTMAVVKRIMQKTGNNPGTGGETDTESDEEPVKPTCKTCWTEGNERGPIGPPAKQPTRTNNWLKDQEALT